MEISLSESDLKVIEEQSVESLPNESCGILLGELKESSFKVKEVITAENQLNAPTLFEIDPELVCEVLDNAEERGLELVGFYHSHPNIPAYVSSRDAEFMKLWPDIVWVIASVEKDGIKDVKAFFVEDDEAKEITVTKI